MRLRIDVTTVVRVFLEDGAWCEVFPGSLTMDPFQWTDHEGITIASVELEARPPMGHSLQDARYQWMDLLPVDLHCSGPLRTGRSQRSARCGDALHAGR